MINQHGLFFHADYWALRSLIKKKDTENWRGNHNGEGIAQ